MSVRTFIFEWAFYSCFYFNSILWFIYWKKKTEAKGLLFMETSALESTNVESAFLEVLTGEFAFYFVTE